MPRPRRRRKVCEEPYFSHFAPIGAKSNKKVEMTVDEYEVVRLVDYEGKTHEECAKQMDVSRTTVTGIYDSARFKIADSIVNGKALIIKGGDFRLCEGNARGCVRCEHIKKGKNVKNIIIKGDEIMRIAVTYENGMVFQHFGHASKFKVYDVEAGKVVGTAIMDTDGQGHGALSALLGKNGVDALICGGIGGGAQMALNELGIKIFGGVSGRADDVVNAYLNGELEYNPNVKCSHHEHEHGDSAHVCGDHGCGKGNCHHGE